MMSNNLKTVGKTVAKLRADGKLDDLASPIAADIRNRMREYLTEQQLIGIDYLNTFIYLDTGICGSHDYIDANEPAFEGVGDFCERVYGVDRGVFKEQALTNDDEGENGSFVAVDLMNLGWTRLKSEGFSRLWGASDDDDLRRNIGVLVYDLASNPGTRKAMIKERQDRASTAFSALDADESLIAQFSDIVLNNKDADAILAVLRTVTDARKGPVI
jgi:hypothetical protein